MYSRCTQAAVWFDWECPQNLTALRTESSQGCTQLPSWKQAELGPLFSHPWGPRNDHQPRTCRPSSRDTFKRVMSGKLSMRVAILNASWASLKMWDEE